ncbi:hypothetical protein ACWEPM_25495 [Streptomyces sp. NPDC004244]
MGLQLCFDHRFVPFSHGAGRALDDRLTVSDDGTAEGRFVAHASFMPARSQALTPIAGDLSSRVAYPATERRAVVAPTDLDEPMQAVLAQLAAPAAQVMRARAGDGSARFFVFDPGRELFAELVPVGGEWLVRQGGPVSLWDDIERALLGWAGTGRPGVTAIRLRVTERAHTYWIDGSPDLQWRHQLC